MNILLWFFLVSFVSTATPGPVTFYLSRKGVSEGFRPALISALGVLAADALYLLLSITGLTTILLASYELFTVIKWLGAAYLVYLGLVQLKAGLFPSALRKTRHAFNPSNRRVFVGGFALQTSNPKALLFFGSLVPQFVDPARPIAAQLISLALIHLSTAACVFIAYAAISSKLRSANFGPRIRRMFNILTGGFFISAGVSLTLLRRIE